MKAPRGLTVFLSFGRWGGVYFKGGGGMWRICLGFVAVTVMAWDDVVLVEATSTWLDYWKSQKARGESE